MKAINNKLPFRKVLTYSLITAQLLSTQLLGSYALATNGGAPAAPRFTGGAKPSPSKPSAPSPALSGLSRDKSKETPSNKVAPKDDSEEMADSEDDSETISEKLVEKATEKQTTVTTKSVEAAKPSEPVAPSKDVIQLTENDRIQGNARFNVDVQTGDEKESYTVEAKIVEEVSSAQSKTKFAVKDGQVYSYNVETSPESKKYKAELTVYAADGTFVCSSAAGCLESPTLTGQLTDLEAAVTQSAEKGLAKLVKNRKEEKAKKEKEDKLLKSCKAVRGDDGEITKITSKNRMENFDALLACYVDNATEDVNPDKNDEELTVKELRDKKKIGGLLRDAMNSEDADVRSLAIDGIESLQDQFGDTSRSVRTYLSVLEDGAHQLNRIKTQHTMQDLNDSVGAWSPNNYLHKSPAYQAAVADVFSGFQDFACSNTSNYRQSGASYSGLLNCSSSTEDVGNLPNGGGLRRVSGQTTQFGNQQVSNQPFANNQQVMQQNNFPGGAPNTGAIYNSNQRINTNLANPNQYNLNNQQGNLGRRF